MLKNLPNMSDFSQTVIKSIAKSFSTKKPTEEEFEEFGERISSFLEGQKWATRSTALSPSKCAQYGWQCINSNLLECVTCNAKLCTNEPSIEIYDAYKACIEKILTDLRECHNAHCPWPLTPSPESFVKMTPLPKEEVLDQFVQRLKICLDYECSIPGIKESMPSLLGINQQHVMSLCKLAEISSVDVHLIGMSVVCMAATGWSLLTKKSGNEKIYVKCANCQRLIWVKSFNLINALDTEEALTSERENTFHIQTEQDITNGSPRKRIKLEKLDFDPLEEHRPWCLWVSPTHCEISLKPNNEKEKEPSLLGWQIYVKSLLRNVTELQVTDVETSPSKEQIKNAKNLLESWTSPTS